MYLYRDGQVTVTGMAIRSIENFTRDEKLSAKLYFPTDLRPHLIILFDRLTFYTTLNCEYMLRNKNFPSFV